MSPSGNAPAWLRPVLIFNNVVVWISALIVMGILSHFISENSYLGSHVVYEEVISVFTVIAYLPGVFLASTSNYRGLLLPLNFAFSYLWLTSFVLSASDYSQNRCLSVLPYNSCNLKHTVEAFNFLAFFFIFANVMIETFYFGWNLRSQATTTLNEKERPGTASTAPVGGPHAV